MMPFSLITGSEKGMLRSWKKLMTDCFGIKVLSIILVKWASKLGSFNLFSLYATLQKGHPDYGGLFMLYTLIADFHDWLKSQKKTYVCAGDLTIFVYPK